MSYSAGQKLRASQMSVYVCTSSTRPTGHSGQIIYETDTGMTAIYSGSAWYYLAPTGEVASDAEYNASGNQTIPTATDTIVAFGTTNVSSPLVTRGTTGAGHYFRLGRAGRWYCSTTIRYASANTGERYAILNVGGSGRASAGSLLAGSAPITLNLSAAFRITPAQAGTSAADVDVRTYQTSGADRDLEANNGTGWCRIALSWLGP